MAVAASILPAATTASARPTEPLYGEPVRVVVGVDAGGERAAREAITAAGGRVVKRGYKGRFLVAETSSSAGRFEDAVEGEVGVDYADPDRRVRAAFVPNDPYYNTQWHLEKIGAPLAWDTTRGDTGTVIAVIDTGVDLDHPDLADNIDRPRSRSFISTDPLGPAYMDPFDAQDYDAEGHGTHVAGIAAAVTDNGNDGAGIANKCTILPIRVLNSAGWGTEADIASAIYYATDQGADVINLSLGGPGYDPTMDAATQYAIAHDVLVVAAAGNEGKNEPFYPAANAGVFAVAATNVSDARASFSNIGSYIDIAAPGVGINSTKLGGGMQNFSGTSMASPMVAGSAALVRSRHPGWTQDEVATALTSTAVDLGLPGRDDYYGHGRLNLADALDIGSADDEIPGKPLTAAYATQRVNSITDTHDVYSLNLIGGERVVIGLDADMGSSIDVRLLSPGSTSLATADVLAEATGTVDPKTITFDVPADGTYYVDVSIASGSGGYKLEWAHGSGTSSTLAGPSIVSWGGSATLTGTVTLLDGSPVVGGTVKIEARPYGSSSWSTVALPTTVANGAFLASVSPTKRTEYRATFPSQNSMVSSTSSIVVVQPKAYLTTPSAPSSVYKGRYFTAAGYLKPRHTAGHRDVKLSCYRLESGTWKFRKSVYATNANYGSYTKYAARFTLPYRGKWKIVATIAGDTTHVATTSGARYLTVK